jgi:hypothetical protein
MPLNISDAESSFLNGRAEFNKWIDEFMQNWLITDEMLMIGAAIIDAKKAGMGEHPSIKNTEKLLSLMIGRKG